MSGVSPPTRAEAASRVRALIGGGYRAPGFEHVPDPDSALFLCAVDHKAGYEREHRLEGRGPFRGSALMWEAALAAQRERPGLLRARRLERVSAAEVAEIFVVEGDTVADPGRRARLWRDLARGLVAGYRGSTENLLDQSAGRLAGEGGLLSRLAGFEAYADPLQKKPFLFAKICERRGWLDVADPESWQVSADSVLMRVALRAGLVEPGPLELVRAATRTAMRELAVEAGVEVPVLDDLVWELGRENPDVLGTAGGDLREPPRDAGSHWF